MSNRVDSRVDANHPAIREGLRDLGFNVVDTSSMGRGYPDLTVVSRRGIICLMEIKMPGKHLSKAEKIFHSTFKGPKTIVTSLEEALAFLAKLDGPECLSRCPYEDDNDHNADDSYECNTED